MKMKVILMGFTVICLIMTGCSNPAGEKTESGEGIRSLQQLSQEFANPPASYRPGAFWCWLNGDVTKASLTHDLEEMKEKGMARAEIWDVQAVHNPNGEYGIGPAFMGDSSVEFIKYALSEGKRLGMKIGLVASSGWNAGGSWVTPDWAAKALYSSELNITGPRKFSGPLPFPEVPKDCPKNQNGMPVYYKEVAVLAIPDNPEKNIHDLSDVIILNKNFDGKTLNWQVPEGKWTLLRFICSNTGQHLIVPSPNSNGLFIDFFDPAATRRHLTYFLNRLGITKDNARESGLGYFEFDSMELSESTPWTGAMDSIFRAHYHYDILPYLPAFNGWKLPGRYDQFLYQFKKTVSDQLILSHYITGSKFLADYGMELMAEAGGPGPPIWDSCPVDALKALGNSTVPRGEFWVQNPYHIFLVKEIASASHIYGSSLVDAESFTTWRRWKDAPHDLKKDVDRAFCEGLNEITFHAFANTRPEFGLPGRTYHAGLDVNPTTTWWEYARPFMDYLSRCSYMLRQGTFVADVAWYYGDEAPNFFPELQGSPDKPGIEGLSFGHDFDIVNTEVLLNRMNVSGGKLVLPDGMHYKLLVLPAQKVIPDPVVKKVDEMIRAGAKVLIQNPEIAKKVHGDFYTNMTVDEALQKLSVEKDFTGEASTMDFIHRKDGKTDIYFVRNKTGKPVSEDCQFRIARGKPEFWDPVTGGQYVISDERHADGKTQLHLRLPSYGSCFIVFNSRRRNLPKYNWTTEGQTKEITGPWTLSFPENWGAPASVRLNQLISWTDSENEGIQYFSGTARYIHDFNLSAEDLQDNHRIILDLGAVRDVAEVIVNGKSAGILWTSPFRLNISDKVVEGTNELEIKVANMWVNRLTGDMNSPEGERYCRTNQPYIRKSHTPVGDEEYRLQESGLLGPVRIVMEDQ